MKDVIEIVISMMSCRGNEINIKENLVITKFKKVKDILQDR